MAFEAGTIIARMKAELSEFKKGINDAKAAGSSLASGLKGNIDNMNKNIKAITPSLQKASLGIAAVGGAATLAIRSWVAEAIDGQREMAQLESVIKSTGGAAGLTVEDIDEMSKALQRQTTVSAGAIMTGQNILLTFTGIKKDAFEPATRAMLDMATAMNGGATPSAEMLKGTATQLGKALNDPIAGINALSRNGVVFTEQQKAQIETLVKSGDTLAAQKIILNELALEYGGSAAAQAETFAGKIEQLNNRFSDFKDQLGNILIPILERVVGWLSALMTWFENLSPTTQKVIAVGTLVVAVFAAIAAPLLILVSMIPAFVAGLGMIGAGLAILFSPITVIIGLFIALGVLIYKYREEFIAFFTILWDNLSAFFSTVWSAWTEFMNNITLVIQNGLLAIWNAWTGTIDFLVGLVIKFVSAAKTSILGFWEDIKAAFELGKIVIGKAWEALWTGFTGAVSSAVQAVKDTAGAVFDWFAEKIAWVMGALGKAGEFVSGLIPGRSSKSNRSTPRLAEGGIVTRPTLAMIGEGGESEAVIPLSKLGNIAGGGGLVIGRGAFEGAIISSEEAATQILEAAWSRMRPRLGV